MIDLEILLDAIRDVNLALFSLPMITLLHTLAISVALLIFFSSREQRKWVNAATKTWLALSQFLLVAFILSVAHVLSQNDASSVAVLYVAAAPYGVLGVLFFVDVWRQRIDFLSDRRSVQRCMGLTVALGGVLLYPITQLLAGYRYPRMVVYGAEIPTVTYVIGLLIMALDRSSALFKAFLALICVVGILAGGGGVLIGYWNDLYLAVGGVLGLIFLGKSFVDSRQERSSASRGGLGHEHASGHQAGVPRSHQNV
jgi:hypothetical protein